MRYFQTVSVCVLFAAVLAACQVAESTPVVPEDLEPLTALPGSTPENPQIQQTQPSNPLLTPEDNDMGSPSPPDETSAWTNYQNTQAGYSIEYPADWTLNESIGANGEFITTFVAPNNAQGIIVSVLNSETATEPNLDMPNTRCQQVTVSGLSGQRCFDTVAFSISTVLLGQDKQYSIATFGKHPDQNIYQRFLESFTVTS